VAEQTKQSSAVLFLAFAGLGGTAAVIPAVLPTALDRSPADATTYLQAVPATFTGLLLGVLLSTVLIRATSTRAVLGLGSLIQAGALSALLSVPPAAGFVLTAGWAGLGFGLVEAAGSALARESAGASTTRLLAALTGTVALVAATCPLIVAYVPSAGAPSIALVLVAAIHLATAGGLAAAAILLRRGATARRSPRGLGNPTEVPPASSSDGDRTGRRLTGQLVRTLAAVALALALYVGVESAFSGWSAVIAGPLLGTDAQRAAVGTSVFWILMATGRFAAWVLLRAPRQPGPFLIPAAAAILLIAAAAAGGTAAGVVALCGAVIFLGPCYSVILGTGLSLVSPADAARVTGPLVACGAVGGAGIPWLVLAGTSNPTSRAVPILSAALLLVVGLLVAVPRPHAAAEPYADARRLPSDAR